jgi:hypothetical protein
MAIGRPKTRGPGSEPLRLQVADAADLVDGGLASVDPFLEFQAGLADLEAQALEVGGLTEDHACALGADGACIDRGLFGVGGGALDLFAFALAAARDVLVVGGEAGAVLNGLEF